jgi:signal transduction histidine kinase
MRELSLHILDLAQNSLTAGAARLDILVAVDHGKDELTITLSDDGKGMSPEFVRQVVSPFTTTRTTRKVGLGIPMFKANAELTGGSFSIQSELGKGTTLQAVFVLSSIDRPPLGDLVSTMISLVVSNPAFHFHLDYSVDGTSFVFDTEEIMGVLSGVPLDTPEVVAWMEEYLKEGMESLHGGA